MVSTQINIAPKALYNDEHYTEHGNFPNKSNRKALIAKEMQRQLQKIFRQDEQPFKKFSKNEEIENTNNVKYNQRHNTFPTSNKNVWRLISQLSTRAKNAFSLLISKRRNDENDRKMLTYEEKVKLISEDKEAFNELKEFLRTQKLITNYALKQFIELEGTISSRANAIFMM